MTVYFVYFLVRCHGGFFFSFSPYLSHLGEQSWTENLIDFLVRYPGVLRLTDRFVDVLVFRCQEGQERNQQELVRLLSNPLHTLLPPSVHFDTYMKVCHLMSMSTPQCVCVLMF